MRRLKGTIRGCQKFSYALGTDKKSDGKSPFEKHYGRELNTVQTNIVSELVNNEKGVLEQDPKVSFEKFDFEKEVDSTILVRERARGSKLESAFQKRRILDETELTLTFLPEGKKKATSGRKEIWPNAIAFPIKTKP